MWACKSILPGCKLCSRGWKHSGWTNQHPMRNHWRVWVWCPATPAISAFRLGATMAAPQEGSIDAAITSELWGLFHLKKSKEWHWGLSSIGEEVIALLATNLPTRSADSSALLSDRLKLSHDRQWLPSILLYIAGPNSSLQSLFQFVKQTIWCVRLVFGSWASLMLLFLLDLLANIAMVLPKLAMVIFSELVCWNQLPPAAGSRAGRAARHNKTNQKNN